MKPKFAHQRPADEDDQYAERSRHYQELIARADSLRDEERDKLAAARDALASTKRGMPTI